MNKIQDDLSANSISSHTQTNTHTVTDIGQYSFCDVFEEHLLLFRDIFISRGVKQVSH